MDGGRVFELAGGEAMRRGVCEEMAKVGHWMERCGVVLNFMGMYV